MEREAISPAPRRASAAVLEVSSDFSDEEDEPFSLPKLPNQDHEGLEEPQSEAEEGEEDEKEYLTMNGHPAPSSAGSGVTKGSSILNGHAKSKRDSIQTTITAPSTSGGGGSTSIGGASHFFDARPIHDKIQLLTNALVSIKDTTGKFLLRLPDGRVIDTKGWSTGWEWTHGIGLYGLYQYYLLTNSSDVLDKILDWYEIHLAEGTTKNINTMSVFLTLAYLYEDPVTRDRRWLPWLESWADWAMYGLPRTPLGGMQHLTYSEENKNQLWDDTLMMTVMPLAKIGKVLNRPDYVDEAKRQFLLHIQFLFDRETGLFYHGWKFDDEAPGGLGHNFGKARWARGNSWVTMVIPDFVELLELKEGDPLRRYLLDILQAQVQALARLQTKTGLWRTLLDVSEEEGSYIESSATAGFAYGILKAVRKRYISRKYRSVALNAVEAVIQKITKDGELLDTSFGTGMGKNYRHYFEIPRTSMPYGQAMAIMALGEFLRSFI